MILTRSKEAIHNDPVAPQRIKNAVSMEGPAPDTVMLVARDQWKSAGHLVKALGGMP